MDQMLAELVAVIERIVASGVVDVIDIVHSLIF